MGLSRRILAAANDNGGYLTRDQLRMIGLSESAVDRLIRGGDIVPVAAGVFQVIPSDDHADLMVGALLALPGAVVSHQSAAHLLRFPELPALVPTVTVVSTTTHTFQGVTVRRADDLCPEHLVTASGIRCTSGARTLFDLAGILKYRQFAPIAEAAITAGRVKHGHLERVAVEV
ncbi:MAG: type IV toxin-antitoxin system AbiEi family antitoxin domain-containing protein, partial [Acidimicrobiia bacterium]